MTSAACEEEWPQKTARAKQTLKRDRAEGWPPSDKAGSSWKTLKGNESRREATGLSCRRIRRTNVIALREYDQPAEAGR